MRLQKIMPLAITAALLCQTAYAQSLAPERSLAPQSLSPSAGSATATAEAAPAAAPAAAPVAPAAPAAAPAAVATATATVAPPAPPAPAVATETTTDAEKPPKYAAIAVSPDTMEFASVTGKDSQKEAEDEAKQKCAASPGKPTDCDVEMWFYDQCGALAMFRPASLDDDGWWDTAFADTKEEAEAEAMKRCLAEGAGCKIVSSICSY